MAKKSSSFNIDALIANEQIINSNISEEIEDATLVYAMKTIVDRALPDVRDGLKPVLRRILFTSNEKGYLPNKGYIKNAKIVGDTMGEYHPHGDGCLDYYTKVMLSDGTMKNIGDLYKENKDQYIICVDKNGNPKLSRAYAFRVGKTTNQIYHLKLSNGKEIKCTDNHKFLTKALNWKRADELKINNILYSAILNQNKDDLKYRPSINMNYNDINTRIAYLSGEYKFGKIKKGNIVHHMDEKPFNNHPNNLMNLSKKEHDLLHKSYNKGLDLGRERMINGDLKEKTIAKNSYLMKEHNKNQGLNKVIKTIKELQDECLIVNEENYNIKKSSYYNYPEISKMVKRGQVNSFEHLVQISNNTDKFINFNKDEVHKGVESSNIEKIESKIELRNSNSMLKRKAFNGLMFLLEKGKQLSKENYNNINIGEYSKSYGLTNVIYIDKIEEIFGFDNIVEEFKWQYPYIESIEVEYLDEEIPMYDFSVDEHENMFIVTDVKDNKYSMVIAHNSIYSAEVAMAQPWTYRYPLIDFHGNKGNVDGDGAAAMRYTEGKLDKRAMTMLEDLDKECVKFKPNYSETKQEPEVLPGLFPNLLLNGTTGIAVGYTTAIPSHQLGEVVDAIIYTVKHHDCTLDDLMQFVKGPDFPGGGRLVDNENIRLLYETGKATLLARGRHKLETNDENGNTQIVFTEIPPNVQKPKLVEQIYNLCFEKKVIPRVNDVRDESEGDEIRIVVELHKTGVPDIVINELYSKSGLEKNSTYILRCIVNQIPKVLSLKQIIEYYIDHRRSVVDLRTKYLLNKAQYRLILQEGYRIVLGDIKKAVEIITDSDDDKIAKRDLMAHFGLNEEQTSQILEMKLRSLTKLNKDDLTKLINDLKKSVDEYSNILSSTKEIDKIIISELRDLKSKFNDERKTEIVEEGDIQVKVNDQNANDLIALVLTYKNNIKHVTLKALDDMFKNKALRERTNVFVQGVKCQMNSTFLLILENGEYVKVDFNDLMGSMTFLPDKVKIKSIVVCDDNEDKTIFVMTKKGIIKKVKLSGFKARLRRTALLFNIEDDDRLVCVRVSDDNEDNIITILTKDGLIHRFFAKSFKDTAAGGKGINGILLSDNNEVIHFDVTNRNDDDKTKIIIYAKHDDGKYSMKSMPITEFKPKGRVSQGVIGIEFTKKQPGELIGMVISSEDFFTVDSKGIVTVNNLELLPDFTRYNKAKEIDNEVFVTKFFLE